MKKQRVGIIHFLTKEEGGREQPPTTVLEYRPTTHIAQKGIIQLFIVSLPKVPEF